MKLFRRDFIFFILGVLSLGIFGWFVRNTMKKPSAQPEDAPDDVFALTENASQTPVYRLDDLEFRVERRRKTACAYHAETGELVWESHGEEQFIVPGAAFPIDLSATGELWVANVGRKRLEQLDPNTGEYIAFWEPRQAFGGCCNPVRFAALPGGRFVTMEKGTRRACVYLPSGELEAVITDALSDSEFNYYLIRDGETVNLYDTGVRKHWEVR